MIKKKTNLLIVMAAILLSGCFSAEPSWESLTSGDYTPPPKKMGPLEALCDISIALLPGANLIKHGILLATNDPSLLQDLLLSNSSQKFLKMLKELENEAGEFDYNKNQVAKTLLISRIETSAY